MPFRAIILIGIGIILGGRPLSAQALETETSRLLPAHALEAGTNFEYQLSSNGNELALPFAVEYGITNSWELLVEPVPYTRIRANDAPQATGLGDLEATLTHRFLDETAGRPALSLAGEVKFPTAESRDIGTDQWDYTGYLIASKRFGTLDLHANVGYAILGQPVGAHISNVVNFALAGVVDLTPRTQFYSEALVTTSASPTGVEIGAAAEVAGGEVSGTIGLRRLFGSTFAGSLGLTYDNSGAVQVRPGFTLRLH